MKKIIFISCMPFDDYQLKRFSIQKYINEGWQVECWRLKYLIKKSHNDSFKKFEEYENSKKIVYRFNSFFELLKHMLKLKKNFFIYAQNLYNMSLIEGYWR